MPGEYKNTQRLKFKIGYIKKNTYKYVAVL